MVDITPVIEALILLIATLITCFAIPWIKSKTSNEKLLELTTWVTAAVEAAEQIYIGTGRGEEKKAYVVAFLESKGFTVDYESLDSLIEAAVYNLPAQFSIIE